jgi:hypothetical protein
MNEPTEKKKIHHRDDFELCYLRHQYFKRASKDITAEEMKPYEAIAAHMARNTYYTYKNLFHMIGFDAEDIGLIAKVHLISFLGLFSLDKLPEKYNDFVTLHRDLGKPDPTKEQVMCKDKANCTLFIKQRMEDVVRVCRQKARNIKGLPTEEFFFYCGPKKPPMVLKDLVGVHERYGYRKLDQAVYKSIRKKVPRIDGPVFRFNNMYYVAVPVDQKHLDVTDFIGAGCDPYDSIHNMTPEQIVLDIEDESEFEKYRNRFRSQSKSNRAKIITAFIEKNHSNPYYQDEIRTARRVLKKLL